MARLEFGRHKRVAITANDGASDIQTQRDWNGDSHEQIGILGFDGVPATLATDAFLYSDTQHDITAQSGGVDDLATITATDATTNDICLIKAAAAQTITVRHGTGNVLLLSGADETLSLTTPMVLMYDGTNWQQIVPTNAVQTNKANSYGDFLQTFKDNKLKINSPDDADGFTFINSDQTAERTGTIPVLGGDRTFAFIDQIQAFTVNQTFANIIHTGRHQYDKGADVASADAPILGGDGNVFDITGTTTINHIPNTDWQIGSVITLHFDGALTLTHNTGGLTGDEADLFLAGDTNYTTSAGDVLTFVLHSATEWQETSRNALSGTGDALVANPLSQFAATTSAQFAGVISDESGTGLVILQTNPTIITPTIASFANAAHDHTDAAGGANIAAGGYASGSIALADIAIAAKTESFLVAASDETTILSTGTIKTTFRIPYAFTVTGVRASLTTAGTGAALVTVDINDSGTTILSTKITIDATEKTSTTAATAPVISDSALGDDAEITVDIDTIDTDNVATGLKIYIIGYQT